MSDSVSRQQLYLLLEGKREKGGRVNDLGYGGSLIETRLERMMLCVVMGLRTDERGSGIRGWIGSRRVGIRGLKLRSHSH